MVTSKLARIAFILVFLFTGLAGEAHPARAEGQAGGKEPISVWVGFYTPSFTTICAGEKKKIEFYTTIHDRGKGLMSPAERYLLISMHPTIKVTITTIFGTVSQIKAKDGKASQGSVSFPEWTLEKARTGSFIYEAPKEHTREAIIELTSEMADWKSDPPAKMTFEVLENCPKKVKASGSLDKKVEGGPLVIQTIGTYVASGEVELGDTIKGTGMENTFWDMTASGAGATCYLSQPEGGSGGIQITGDDQAYSEDGMLALTINADEMALNASMIICTGEGGSAEFPLSTGSTVSAMTLKFPPISADGGTAIMNYSVGGLDVKLYLSVIPRRSS